MSHVDLSDRIANSYRNSNKTCNWMKKLFYHLMDLIILKLYILCKLNGGHMTNLKFREQLDRDHVLSCKENTEIRGVPGGWPNSSETQMS
jgi:hypothetical protein